MIKSYFFIGEPYKFKKGVLIYPPKVYDVIVNSSYSTYSRILTYSQEEIEDIFTKEKKEIDFFPTPLEFLLNNCYHNKNYETVCKEAFEFFLKSKVEFLYEKKLILIGDIQEVLKNLNEISEVVTISEEEFFEFQNIIRLATGGKVVQPPKLDEHPKVKAMKAKARYRDQLKAKQNAKNGPSIFTILASICCMGIGVNPLTIGEMSYVAMNAIVAQYQDKEKYQIDIDSLLAGADSKKIKPKYWIRNLEE